MKPHSHVFVAVVPVGSSSRTKVSELTPTAVFALATLKAPLIGVSLYSIASRDPNSLRWAFSETQKDLTPHGMGLSILNQSPRSLNPFALHFPWSNSSYLAFTVLRLATIMIGFKVTTR
jgi:hypothetical protein